MGRWHLLSRTQRERINAAINDLLLHDWDPIGVRTWPEAADEYVNYVPPVLSLLDRNRPSEEIAARLSQFRNEAMGGPPNDALDDAVARKAVQLWNEICGPTE